MIKGKTKSGFQYSISKARQENYELMEALGELEDNPLLIGKVVKLLLGDEQAKALKDHIRDKEGIVPADKMTAEITEIFQSQSEIKN